MVYQPLWAYFMLISLGFVCIVSTYIYIYICILLFFLRVFFFLHTVLSNTNNYKQIYLRHRKDCKLVAPLIGHSGRGSDSNAGDSTLPRSSKLEFHNQMNLGVMPSTPIGGRLPLGTKYCPIGGTWNMLTVSTVYGAPFQYLSIVQINLLVNYFYL